MPLPFTSFHPLITQSPSQSLPAQPVSSQPDIQPIDINIFNSGFHPVALIALFSFLFTVVWLKKQRNRHYTLQQQRELLERIWQLSSKK